MLGVLGITDKWQNNFRDNWESISGVRDKRISFRDNEKQVRLSSGSVFIALDYYFAHYFWLFLTLLIDNRS